MMDGWMEEWLDGLVEGWMGRWMDGRMGGWMDGWMDGWMEGRMDGWVAGRISMCPGGIMEGEITIMSTVVWVPVIHDSKTFSLQHHF